MTTSKLPPLRNLPSWSRVRDLDRVRYPRLLTSDQMVRSPPVDTKSPMAAVQPGTDAPDKRVASLEKDVLFLQQQHKDTLDRLHEEMETLKRANKELQYKLVMEQQNSPKESTRSTSKPSSGGSAQEKITSAGFISSEEAPDAGRGTVTSLLPLRITLSPSQQPRTPTLKECEVIIRQLYQANASQHQELLRIKMALKDISSKNKPSSDAYALAKAFLCDSSRTDVFQHLPKLPRKALPRTQLSCRVSDGDAVVLPAIRRGLSGTMTERQVRAQDQHRMRLRRSVNS